MIEFYQYKDQLKSAIFRRLNQDEFNIQADIAWLLYANILSDLEENPLIKPKIQIMKNWAIREDSLNDDKNLSALSLIVLILCKTNDNIYIDIRKKIIEKLIVLMQKEISKFSFFNNPELLLGVVIGIKEYLPDNLITFLINDIEKRKNTGSRIRQLLYNIILKELNDDYDLSIDLSEITEIEEIITSLWIIEKYMKNKNTIKISSKLWNTFYNIRSSFELNLYKNGETYIISTFYLVLLYEAVLRFLENPNPLIILNLIPLEEEIKQQSINFFKKEEYLTAVWEAVKVLETKIRMISGFKTDFGTNLINKCFTVIKKEAIKPLIVFNNYEDKFEKKEHEYLTNILLGIFGIFRNPKGHTPISYFNNSNTFEAIEQLILINYILRRIKLSN